MQEDKLNYRIGDLIGHFATLYTIKNEDGTIDRVSKSLESGDIVHFRVSDLLAGV